MQIYYRQGEAIMFALIKLKSTAPGVYSNSYVYYLANEREKTISQLVNSIQRQHIEFHTHIVSIEINPWTLKLPRT